MASSKEITDGRVPVLAIHGGLGLDHRYLRHAAEAMSEWARVGVFDLPGHGPVSSRSSIDGFAMADMVDAIESVRQATFDAPVTLFGHSYGGFLALEFARRHPQHVAGLMLLGTSASLTGVSEAVARVLERASPLQREALTSLLTAPPSGDDEFANLWRTVLPLYFASPDADSGMLFRGASFSASGYSAGARWLQRYDLRSQLREVDVPVLIMHGRHDWLFGEDAGVELAGEFASRLTTVVRFERSAHFPFVEEPEAFSAAARLWGESAFPTAGSRA